jgi:hypothetical protein
LELLTASAVAGAHDVTAVTDHCDAVADQCIKDVELLDQIDDAVTIENQSEARAWLFDLIQRSFVQGLALGIAATRRGRAIKQNPPARRERRGRRQKVSQTPKR